MMTKEVNDWLRKVEMVTILPGKLWKNLLNFINTLQKKKLNRLKIDWRILSAVNYIVKLDAICYNK